MVGELRPNSYVICGTTRAGVRVFTLGCVELYARWPGNSGFVSIVKKTLVKTSSHRQRRETRLFQHRESRTRAMRVNPARASIAKDVCKAIGFVIRLLRGLCRELYVLRIATNEVTPQATTSVIATTCPARITSAKELAIQWTHIHHIKSDGAARFSLRLSFAIVPLCVQHSISHTQPNGF